MAIAFIIILTLLSALLGWIGRGAYEYRHAMPPQLDTVWQWKHDTVRLVETKYVGNVAAKLQVAKVESTPTPACDTLQASDHFRDTAKMVEQPDSVVVEVPIEQRTYEGENYRAVVQGWRPELVSIVIKLPELAAPRAKRKWWSVTVGPQIGYGFTPAGWQPYAGIGANVGVSF